MTILIIIISILATLDTCIGNWVFPGKEGIEEYKGKYYLYKWNRVVFIPFKAYDASLMEGINSFIDFVPLRNASGYSNQDGAMEYLTKNRKAKLRIDKSSIKEVYTTKSSRNNVVNEDLNNLTKRLIEAPHGSELELNILKEMKIYK